MAESISEALKSANSRAKNDPSEQELAQLSKTRGERAAKSNSPTLQREYIAKQGEVEKAARKRGDKTMSRSEYTQLAGEMPAYKKGGKVKKTGPAVVHKGERVLTVKQNKKFEKGKKMKTGKKVGKASKTSKLMQNPGTVKMTGLKAGKSKKYSGKKAF